ncbi:MAG TPA: hypothetical protein VGI60_07890 [Chthoniobacterales bacterium]|jgi:hypothetical protein
MPKPEPPPDSSTDPDALAKAVEMELISKRAAWEKARARRGHWRALSLLFLFLIILGAALAFFYFLPDLRSREEEKGRPAKTEMDR